MGGESMKNTSLCYIERGEEWLLLHRTKKENDLNKDKWIGVGGKFEDKESPEECVLREVYEETGLTLKSYAYRGIVTFVSSEYETEYMHLFTADGFDGEPGECSEGDLEWIAKKEFAALPQWEGDRIFLDLLEKNVPFFSLKLQYEKEKLVYAALNGKQIRGYAGAVFFDLDGTLLDNTTDCVPDSAKEALRELKENHFLVCLSTGRDMDTHYSQKYMEEVKPDAVIHLNGNKLSVGSEVIFMHHMEESLLKRIFDYAQNEGFCVGTSIGNADYYLNPELKTKADRAWNKNIERNYLPVSELFEKHIPVIAVNFAGMDTYAVKENVEKNMPEIKLFPFNKGTGADVVEIGFSKAEGMEKICAYFGIDLKNTYAFGDSPNDLPMLEKAAMGVAMGNASAEVREAADMVTDRVDENGISNALKKLGLIC